MLPIKRLFLLTIIFFSCSLLAEDGVTKDKIILGQSADFKGVLSNTGLQLKEGADAYFSFINSKGGVKGKKIDVISLNDDYDGNKTLGNTIDLIREKKVFALFGYLGTPNMVAALPVIQKFSSNGIFLFSSYSGAQPQREKPHRNYTYNIRSSYRDETAGLVDHLLKIGKKKIALFVQFDSYGRAGANGVALELRKHNLEIVAETSYLRGTRHESSMKEQVQAIINSGADAVIAVAVADASLAFIRDARLAGFNVPIANLSPDSADLLTHLINEEKKYGRNFTFNLINSQVVPPLTNTSSRLVQEYVRIMQAANLPLGATSLEGFLNAKVFIEVLKKIKGEVTRKSFKEAANGIRNLDIGLGENKINFNNSANQGLSVVYYTTIKNHQYVLINDWNTFR